MRMRFSEEKQVNDARRFAQYVIGVQFTENPYSPCSPTSPPVATSRVLEGLRVKLLNELLAPS